MDGATVDDGVRRERAHDGNWRAATTPRCAVAEISPWLFYVSWGWTLPHSPAPHVCGVSMDYDF